jgi:hypothetical protein
MVINKDNTGRTLLLTALFMVVLQGANLVGVALNTKDIKRADEKISFMWKDYVPMWFLEGMQKNQDFKTEEIVATLKGDKDKIKEINKKYMEFQTTMMNDLIRSRGVMTQVTRGGYVETQTVKNSK